MLRFEVITSSFDKHMDRLQKKADQLPVSALNYMVTETRKHINELTPVFMGYRGEDLYGWDNGTYSIGTYDGVHGGGTLLSSFIDVREIGSYKATSIYRMSGEDNPVSDGFDYATAMELDESVEHSREGAEAHFLRDSVMFAYDGFYNEGLVRFISNELYLK